MIIIGHQGAKGHYLGNTLRSIKIAKTLNTNIIELDVRLLDKEKIFILHHDDKIKLLDETEKIVEECIWNELKMFGICTLNHALGEFETNPEFVLYLDVKINKNKDNDYLIYFGKKLLNILKDLNILVLICSFNKRFINLFSKLEGNTNFNLGYIFEKNEEFQNNENVDIMVFHDETTYNQDLIKKLKKQNKICFVYTINDEERKKQIKNEKLFDGYVTDFP